MAPSGVTMVGLFSAAITRAERKADAPYREAMAADSDEVARAFRDDVARCSDMMSPGVRCLAG
jgi:hypothetical protein